MELLPPVWYGDVMEKTLEEVLNRASTWPKADHEELARIAREIESERSGGVYRFSDDERAVIEEGLAQAERGEYVPDEEMEAFFQSCKA